VIGYSNLGSTVVRSENVEDKDRLIALGTVAILAGTIATFFATRAGAAALVLMWIFAGMAVAGFLALPWPWYMQSLSWLRSHGVARRMLRHRRRSNRERAPTQQILHGADDEVDQSSRMQPASDPRIIEGRRQGVNEDHPPGVVPERADLTSEQFAMLRDAVATFDKFVAIEDSGARFAGDDPNTVVLLHLPEVDERLLQMTEISLLNVPDVRWANRVAGAVARAVEHSRGFIGYTANEDERDALRRSIREVRDLIADQYPGLLGS